MTLRACYALIILIHLIVLVSCRSAPVQDIESHPIAIEGLSLFEVKRAIMLGCQRAEWKLLSVKPGEIIASYSAKKGKYSATSKITYDNQAYSINYLSSKNLSYSTIKNDTDDPAQVISDINPFDPVSATSDQDPAKPRRVIHKVYNQWVQTLQSEIDLAFQLRASGSTGQTTPAGVVSTPVASRQDCHHTPDRTLSGYVRVTGSRVNIRSGIGKRCSIINTAYNGDTFAVLGKKGSWTQVEMDSGKTAWIYSALVKKVSQRDAEDLNSEKPTSSGNPPPPPLPPSKKISIAVIHFKTLNQKAQEIELGNLVSEMFTSKLVNSQSFKIIERDQLDKVVHEMEMNQTGFIESSDAVEVGKMLHADAIITGSVALLDKQVQINARIIEIESAYVLDADTQSNNYSLRNMSRIVEKMVRKFSFSLR